MTKQQTTWTVSEVSRLADIPARTVRRWLAANQNYITTNGLEPMEPFTIRTTKGWVITSVGMRYLSHMLILSCQFRHHTINQRIEYLCYIPIHFEIGYVDNQAILYNTQADEVYPITRIC